MKGQATVFYCMKINKEINKINKICSGKIKVLTKIMHNKVNKKLNIIKQKIK